MKKVNRLFKKSICIILAVALVTSGLSLSAYAADTTGTYEYSANAGSNKQNLDDFAYHDECFEHSSYIEDVNLIVLSEQAALASSSRYGDGEDKYEQDVRDTAENVKAMLTTMGFQDVESNRWTNNEMEENSIGVTVGRRTITANGNNYTLLAIIPRSAGYRQEWAGNMNVGEGEVHEGFLEARDEALRFTKQYIDNHNVTGSLKVWIAGHSRGGATSNLIGGFFAGGGIGYFGNSVTISPEDVYCYTFATPRTIKNGASNNTVLSVSSARTGSYIQIDTPGVEYKYTGGGNVDCDAEMFKGIRNYPFAFDFVPYLPFEKWGFRYYGGVYSLTSAPEKEMERELENLDENVYQKYEENANPSDFHEKRFDVAELSMVDKEGGDAGQSGMVSFLSDRMNHVVENFPTTQVFVNNGYQDAFMSALGFFSLLQPLFGDIEGITSYVVQPVLFSYLDYASKKLVAEGKATDEWDGAALVIEQFLEYTTGKNIDPDTFKVDDLIKMLGEFVRDNKDKEAINKLKEGITKAVPAQYQSIAKSYLGNFYPGSKDKPGFDPSGIPMGDIAIPYLIACADGADPTSKAYKTSEFQTAEGVRKNLYSLVGVMSYFAGGDVTIINDAIANGNGSFKGFVKAFLQMMMKYTGEDGKTATYEHLADAADGDFRRALDLIKSDAVSNINTKGLYNDAYKTKIMEDVIGCRNHIAIIRDVVIDFLFGNSGNYDLEKNINNVATFIGNINRIPFAHYMELYVSYAKALGINVTGISITPVSNYINVGESFEVEATITPDNATEKGIIWSSSNEKVASVDSNGKVTGKGYGSATITAMSIDGNYKANCVVTILSPIPPSPTPDPPKPDPPEPIPPEPEKSDNVVDVDLDNGTATVKDKVGGGDLTVSISVITEGPIYRMYDPNRGEHFFTKEKADVELLEKEGWIHEEDGDLTVVSATDVDAVPVYRLYNPNGGGMHFYTDDADGATFLKDNGWIYEGISHYVYNKNSEKGKEQYRLYNPNSLAGEHMWTTEISDRDYLVKEGWVDEGVCWRIV